MDIGTEHTRVETLEGPDLLFSKPGGEWVSDGEKILRKGDAR